MGSRRHRLLVGVLPVLPAALSAAVPAAALEPYQTVRSMQLVQDRIADGDHAAMPMQSRVLALADQSMREASPELFDDGRNFEALLVYGMSGGNPVTLDVVMARLKLTPEQKLAGAAVSQYLRGNLGAAAANMQSIEPPACPLAPGLSCCWSRVQFSRAISQDRRSNYSTLCGSKHPARWWKRQLFAVRCPPRSAPAKAAVFCNWQGSMRAASSAPPTPRNSPTNW
jgi:hypothetical protein